MGREDPNKRDLTVSRLSREQPRVSLGFREDEARARPVVAFDRDGSLEDLSTDVVNIFIIAVLGILSVMYIRRGSVPGSDHVISSLKDISVLALSLKYPLATILSPTIDSSTDPSGTIP